MKERQLLEIGCDGGSIIISEIKLNGLSLFQLSVEECFFGSGTIKKTFIVLDDAWAELISKYQNWHMLHPIVVEYNMISLVKDSFLKIKNSDDSAFSYKYWNSLLNKYDLPY